MIAALPRGESAPDAERGSGFACLLVALAMHGACVLGLHGVAVRAGTHASITTEIELAPEARVSEPVPVTPPPPPPAAQVQGPRPRARAAAPKPPARAGALLTAREPADEPTDDEPVRFVSDPNGRSFGFGIVARGGSAERSEAPAVTTAPPAPSANAREAITPADRLLRQPTLLARDGCRGFFPERAQRHHGSVAVIATVRAAGVIARLEIEAEKPTGEGFAEAARACLARQRFEPALDERGRPTAARTRIVIRFSR